MKQIKWFDRKFDFTSKQNTFPSILERLEGTPLRLVNKIHTIRNEQLKVKPDGSWSILENIGHLIDLEPLWHDRLDDILSGEKYLRPADLQNQKTDDANYNEVDVKVLLEEFLKIRNVTLNRLSSLKEEEIYWYALHPRLETPMRVMDLFLFVAEHDDHHLARMTEISKMPDLL